MQSRANYTVTPILDDYVKIKPDSEFLAAIEEKDLNLIKENPYGLVRKIDNTKGGPRKLVVYFFAIRASYFVFESDVYGMTHYPEIHFNETTPSIDDLQFPPQIRYYRSNMDQHGTCWFVGNTDKKFYVGMTGLCRYPGCHETFIRAKTFVPQVRYSSQSTIEKIAFSLQIPIQKLKGVLKEHGGRLNHKSNINYKKKISKSIIDGRIMKLLHKKYYLVKEDGKLVMKKNPLTTGMVAVIGKENLSDFEKKMMGAFHEKSN